MNIDLDDLFDVDPDGETQFLLVREVATIMRVSNMSIYRLIHMEEIPAIRIGRSFRIPIRAVQAYMRAAFVGT